MASLSTLSVVEEDPMTTPLPPIIARYFTAADDRDIDALIGCFTPDAVVTDEGTSRHGQDEIRQWREDVANAYDYTLEVLGTEPAGDQGGLDWHDVLTHLEGNFPGGTVDLTYRFGLLDGYVAALRIGPAPAAASPTS
jgi:ketosteroid isomerase-like protein